MDSLKIPKGGSSSSSSGGGTSKSSGGSVPITVRFNAGDECIDDIFQSFHNNSSGGGGGGGTGGGGGGGNHSGGSGGGGDSLSSSPSQHHQSQQNADEVNTRNNFLQGNFFNRKRSGSIEGISPSSSGPNLIAALSSADPSVGTWKLIKGKVSQTIEDIKSSKSNSQSQIIPTVISKAEPEGFLDSDQDNATVNSSLSDELPLDLDHFKVHHHPPQQAVANQPHKADSDSSIESEILLEGDVERSRLRRGLANLKSKVKAKSHHHHHHHQQQQQQQKEQQQQLHQHHHQHPHTVPALSTAALSTATTISCALGNAAIKTMPKDISPSRSSGSSSAASLRGGFLRKRRKQPVETAELATPSAAPGETIPMIAMKHETNKKKEKGIIAGKKDMEIESGVEMLEDMIPPPPTDDIDNADDSSTSKRNRGGMELPLDGAGGATRNIDDAASTKVKKMDSNPDLTHETSANSSHSFGSSTTFSFQALRARFPIMSMAGLLIVLFLPIADFIRGALACLFVFAIVESFSTALQNLIETYLVTNPPEKNKFQIPDYTKMSICEIPAVEEHKTVKAYAGWMSEVNSYDPNNFHITMSKSVYVKLDGTILRVSTTTARIPKRVMWNEVPVERKSILFTDHRVYNLFGCRIELLPLGLARKRYFNRKYPIQLIIKNTAEQRMPENLLISLKSKCPSEDDNDSKDSKLSQQHPAEHSTDDRAERPVTEGGESEVDFAATILNSDLQVLQETVNPDADQKEIIIPRGDEVRLLLFSRGDREKEDWYRRFVAASTGEVHDQDLRLPNVKLVDCKDLQAAAAKAAIHLTDPTYKDSTTCQLQSTTSHNITFEDSRTSVAPDNILPIVVDSSSTIKEKQEKRVYQKKDTTPHGENSKDNEDETDFDLLQDAESFEGLLMSSCSARNPVDYIRFMALYQNACNKSHIPVYIKSDSKIDITQSVRRQRRSKRQSDELWKGIDQSLFLGPSGSVVWANVLIGRVLYSCLHDNILKGKIQDFLQKKLSSIKLPSFMEDVVITQIFLGDTPPLIHRVSQPMLDERGTWLDADLTYEGLLHITVTTKLNLLRLKRQARTTNIIVDTPGGIGPTLAYVPPIHVISDDLPGGTNGPSMLGDEHQKSLSEVIAGSAIFDSDAESSGGSSSEPESPAAGGSTGEPASANDFNLLQNSPGNARRIFKIVDRITASNLFQYATELSYVQRAMENMNANITLRVELKGLVGRGTINIPPPPSDRVWLSFRGPPRLWISAKPAVGDKSVDWSIVTNIIESKLCEEVNKYLVFPNMVDVTIPFLGQPTYTTKGDNF